MKRNASKIQRTSLLLKSDNIKELSKQKFIQSNQLVEAIFIQPFKELELKVLCLISKYINENKYEKEITTIEQAIETYMKIEIRKEDFCKTLKTNPLNFYKQMHELAEELTNKKIKIKNLEKNNFDVIVLFPRVSFKDGNAIFYMSYLMNPYLQHLKNNFTISNIEYISNLGSIYAIRIYQLLNQYRSIKKRIFQIKELKHILCLNNDYLNNFKHFKQNVLTVAKEHINKYTDLKINFKSIKEGRVVNAIEFQIEENKNQSEQAYERFYTELEEILNSEKCKKYLNTDPRHKFFQNHWKELKDDINMRIFEIWKNDRVESYDTSSSEKLKTKPKSGDIIPDWYIKVLREINILSEA